MGMKRKARPTGLKDAHPCDVSVAGLGVDGVERSEGGGEDGESEGDEPAVVDAADEEADQGHEKENGDAAWRDDEACLLGGVAHQLLDVERDEDGGPEKGEAEDEHQQPGNAEGAIAEHGEVEDGPVSAANLGNFPEDEDEQRGSAHEEEGGDEVRAEPVVLLAFVEDELQGAEADGEQAEAGVVEIEPAFALVGDFFADVGWIFNDARGEEEGENGDGDVDEEDPAPGVVVGDPAAERGTDGGREDDGHPIDGEGLAAFAGRKGVREDGLLAGLEAAAAGSLEDAEKDEQRKRGSEAAEHGADAKERDADHVEALASEEGDEIGAGRKNDGVGDEVGSQNPGSFVLRRAETAGDVGQRDVGDGGIEDLHEGGQGDGEGDGPGIMLRLPVRVGIRWHRWINGWRLGAGMRMQENGGAGKAREMGI